MKKILLSIALLAGINVNGQALSNGSFANDFTLTDINGTTHNLYSYLSAGKTVFIDISATWCGPCWGLHQSGALEDLWSAHGPAGGTDVLPSTTDDVIVIWIEGDMTTTDAELHGGAGSQGDWVTGVPHPIVDLQASSYGDNLFNNNYPIDGFPTVYKICPNLTVYEVPNNNGQTYFDAAYYYATVGTCPAATSVSDVKALSVKSLDASCEASNYTPSLLIQNNGTSPLTSATITVSIGGNTVSTGTYSGSLETFSTATVLCSEIPNFTGGQLKYDVTTTNDASNSNGVKYSTVTVGSTQATGVDVVIEITTDRYGNETMWFIKDDMGTVVANGGPYNVLDAAGTTVQTPANVTLNPTSCYVFEITDSYGDGMTGTGGNGSYSVKDGANNVITSGGTFTTKENEAFTTGINPSASIAELEAGNFQVYPNPASEKINVSFEAPSSNENFEISVTDVQGRTLISKQLNAISGFQKVELSVADLSTGNYIVKVKSNSTSSVRSIMID